MKRLISLFLAIVIVAGCLPITSFAVEKGKTYGVNSDDVYFAEKYAQIGVPINVKTSDKNEHIVKWFIDGKEIKNASDSYTPVEEDLESMLTAEIYTANGDKLGAANMFISKLPVIYIETEDREPIIEKSTVLKAKLKIQGNDEFNDDSVLYDGETEIKGRGNSTWLADKKPYKLKLDTKSDLLGMGKNKHWVLLSNPYDSSLSRNKLIYDLADDMGLDAMSSQWVDVVLNGEVVGNYLLCEHVRIGSTRVDITDWDKIAEDVAKAIYKANKKSMSKDERDELAELMEENMDWVTEGKIEYKGKTYTISDYYTLPNANGGYLLEAYLNESPSFKSDGGKFVSVSKPEGIGKDMLAGIKDYYSAFERATKTADFCTEYNGQKVRYSDLADVESFAKYALINEIFQNQDFPSLSTYMYKDVDGKLIFGPVWDMDSTSDNSASNYSHYKWTDITRGNILGVIKDPVFMNEFYKAYKKYRYTAIEDMLKPGGDVDTAYKKVYESGLNDDELWQKENKFESSLENFRMWLSRRLDWIDSQMTSFETFYASVNGSGLNTTTEMSVKLNGSTLEISSSAENVSYFTIYVNGVEKSKADFKNNIDVALNDVPDESVISAVGYDSEGNCISTTTVTNYNEPIKLKITKAPQKTTYSAGEKIDLTGLELTAVFADNSEKLVEPESAVSYVSDCIGAQSPVYGYITDELGQTYISLRYRGAKVDYKVERVAEGNAEEVKNLIDALPQSNLLDNLEAIFNAKAQYDALTESEKAKVTNIEKLNQKLDLLNELADNGASPIVGCYIDGLSRYTQRNRIVVVAKGSPNKIRIFSGKNVTTLPVSNRTYCISEKKVGEFSLITVIYALYGEDLQIGAYYNHVLKGELYTFDTQRAYENCNRMITSCSYDKTLSSTSDIETLNFKVVDRVTKIRATGDGIDVTADVEDNAAELNVNFKTEGTKTLKISYYSNGEWYYYRDISILVRTPSTVKSILAIQAPSESAYDEEKVFVATCTDVKSLKLTSGGETLNMAKEIKNGFAVWSCTINMDTDKNFNIFVDGKSSGRSISIKKIAKLLISSGVLVECRVAYGKVDVPQSVTSVADGAFDGFTGTINCYKNSAAHKYAVSHGINYVNYGYAVDIPSELKLIPGESFTVNPTASPIVPPDFEVSIVSDNNSSIVTDGNIFKAVNPGYARVTIKTNDGSVNSQIKVYVGGGLTKGDVNGDGKINSYDALIVLRSSVALTELNEEEKNAADINVDSKVNSTDALIILQISTGTRSVWDFV